MSDAEKKINEAIASYVRSRLRDGKTPRTIRDDVNELLAESIYRELARGLESAEASHA